MAAPWMTSTYVRKEVSHCQRPPSCKACRGLPSATPSVAYPALGEWAPQPTVSPKMSRSTTCISAL